MSDLIPKNPDTTALEYAHVLAPIRPIHSRAAIIIAWVIPAVLQVISWIVYWWVGLYAPFYIGAGFAAGALCGIWQPALIIWRVIPPEGFYSFWSLAVALWTLWLWGVTRPTFRRLPIGLHFGLSVAWNVLGFLLVMATYS